MNKDIENLEFNKEINNMPFNRKSNFIYNDLLSQNTDEYWEKKSLFATMPKIEFAKKFMGVTNLKIVSPDYKFKSLSSLSRTFYRSIDSEYDTKSELKFDENLNNNKKLNRIFIDEDENKLELSYKSPNNNEWDIKGNIDINLEQLNKMYRGISDEGLINGEYILFDDLKQSLLDFYNNNKKISYKVEQSDGKIVKYHLDKRQINKYLDIIKEGHKIIVSEKLNKDDQNNIREISLIPAHSKEYEIKRIDLGNLDLVSGNYININLAVANMNMLFKKNNSLLDRLNKNEYFLPKPIVNKEALTIDKSIVEDPNKMDEIINLFQNKNNVINETNKDKREDLEELINNCLNDFIEESSSFNNNVSKSK